MGRRREAYERVLRAIVSQPGHTMEVRTEYGDNITATRGVSGEAALYNTQTNLPVTAQDRGLGIVAQLTDQSQMTGHMGLFHATVESLAARATTDRQLISIAQAPLDQLFDLAARITADESNLSTTRHERSNLSESIRQRESREESITQQIEETKEGKKTITIFALAALVLVGGGIAATFLLSNYIIGLALCVVGLLIAGLGRLRKGDDDLEAEIEGQALEIQLGRVDELFNTHDLSRNRRSAEEALADSRATWRSLAGDSEPSILLKDRPRIEELASHLQLIRNEPVSEEADTTLLIGFASLLAELNRRFPAERVPLLVDDLFAHVAPQYHSVLRELLLRASHRRQVVTESADLVVTKWAAVEAVGGDAMLISDYDIDVEPIIQQAVGPEGESAV